MQLFQVVISDDDVTHFLFGFWTKMIFDDRLFSCYVFEYLRASGIVHFLVAVERIS
mgnify:CR=1 FL=1